MLRRERGQDRACGPFSGCQDRREQVTSIRHVIRQSFVERCEIVRDAL